MAEKIPAFTAFELENKDFPPLYFPVPGMIAEGVHILAGRPKSGKSWLVLQLAIAMAGGTSALNFFSPTDPIGVVYLALEDGDRRLQRRLRKLIPEGGWPEFLFFCTKDVPGDMDDKIDKINAYLTEGFSETEPAVIFIDTWGRFRPPMRGRNSYEDDYKPMSSIQRFVSDRPHTTVIVVHHTRKVGNDADAETEPMEAVSGTFGLTGAVDSIMLLNRKTGESHATLKMTGRDVEETTFFMQRPKDKDGWECIGQGPANMKRDALEMITAIAGLGGKAGPAAIAARLGMNLETVKKRLAKMLEGEPPILRRLAHGQYAVYKED